MNSKERAKSILHKGLQHLTPTSTNKIRGRFIYYHSVHDSLPRSMRPDVFRQHLRVLTDLGVDLVTQQQALSRMQSGVTNWVAVGFDDGYEDNHRVVMPLLQEYGVKATFYVVAGQVAVENRIPDPGYQFYEGYRMLNANQLREMSAEGHEVASHGLQHELATDVFALGRDLQQEMRQSREILSEYSGQSIVSHSYPNGQRGAFSSSTREVIKRAGFTSSATTLWGRVLPGSDPWLLPRCEISHLDDGELAQSQVARWS